jgi:sortase (surface protein transpeptidase)
LYPQDLTNYRNHLEPAEEIDSNPDYPIKYLSYKFQAKYAYDEDIGFLKIPKIEIVNLQML